MTNMFIAKQHSALSAFVYDLCDDKGNSVGSLTWPDFAVATNARLRNPFPNVLSSKIKLSLYGQVYEITFEYLTRGWFNNIRFKLMKDETILASADVTRPKRFLKRPIITVTAPFLGQVVRRSGLFSVHYELMRDGVTIGTVAEKKGLTIKRELFIDLPDSISDPIQMLILFLVINHAVR